jgi:regulatory protein
VAARRGFPQGRSLTAARQALDARIAELGGER